MLRQPKVTVKENPAELAQAGADLFADIAKDCVSNYDRFSVAVSGGSTPRAMHCLLAQEPFLSEVPWNKTHIFWVDDRCVPHDDPASNFGAARSDLIALVPIPAENVHPIPVDTPPQKGALKYQNDILDFFNPANGEIPCFDLIIMGIGRDGHIASLFPGCKELEEKKRLIVPVKGGDPFVHRLTMTLPILNNARETIFLVSGSNKAEIVKEIFYKKDSCLPAQMIKPANGNLTWLMDSEAARLIEDKV
jgi:6-phosphogluconolactonase